MAISMPKAGTIAGRSASLQVAQPETGTALADFGSRMQQHALRWKADQQEKQVQRTQLAMTRDMGTARIEVEQLGDPVEIGQTWDQRQAEIRAKYITDETPPEVAAALDLGLQDLGNRHGLALAGKVAGLEKSKQEADWIEARDAIVLDAATADPTTFGALIELGEAAIENRVKAGLTDPAGAAQEKIALRQEVFGSRAMAEIDRDPAAWMEAAEAGDYDALGGTDLSAMKVSAQNAIDRRAKEAENAVKVEKTERDRQIGARLTAITSLAHKGQIAVDETYLSDPEVMAHPGWAEARAAVQLRDEQPGIAQMTVAELDQLIAAEKTRPKKEAWETARIEVLTKQRDTAAAAYAADPVSAARSAGLPVPDLPVFDPEDPAAFADALMRRTGFDDFAREGGYSKGPAIFSIEEKKALKTVLDPKAEAGPKVALAQSIIAGTQGRPAEVLASLDADPVFRRSVQLMAIPGNAGLAEEILRGQQKSQLKTVVMPPPKEQKLIFDTVSGGAFDANPALKAELMETALALYADSAAGIDAETQSAEGWIADGAAYSAFQTAIQRSLGATPDRNGNLTIGGLQEIQGAQVVLPAGVPAADAEAMFDNLDVQLRGGFRDPTVQTGGWSFNEDSPYRNDDAMRAFKAASLYKGIPDLGANPSAFLQGLTLHRVGETDVYEFRYQSGGRSATVAQTDGRAYRFRLSDLIGEAGK